MALVRLPEIRPAFEPYGDRELNSCFEKQSPVVTISQELTELDTVSSVLLSVLHTD
jgi:hypothetical protein